MYNRSDVSFLTKYQARWRPRLFLQGFEIIERFYFYSVTFEVVFVLQLKIKYKIILYYMKNWVTDTGES